MAMTISLSKATVLHLVLYTGLGQRAIKPTEKTDWTAQRKMLNPHRHKRDGINQ